MQFLPEAPGGSGRRGFLSRVGVTRRSNSLNRSSRGRRLSAQDARRYAALMVAEGTRVLADAHLPLPVVSAAFLKIPALVIAAADDPLISRQTSRRTAAYHLADYLLAEDCGHLFPIEPMAESIADQVLDWLDHKGL